MQHPVCSRSTVRGSQQRSRRQLCDSSTGARSVGGRQERRILRCALRRSERRQLCRKSWPGRAAPASERPRRARPRRVAATDGGRGQGERQATGGTHGVGAWGRRWERGDIARSRRGWGGALGASGRAVVITLGDDRHTAAQRFQPLTSEDPRQVTATPVTICRAAASVDVCATSSLAKRFRLPRNPMYEHTTLANTSDTEAARPAQVDYKRRMTACLYLSLFACSAICPS